MKDIKLTISNIAWNDTELSKIILLLKEKKIDILEFAPNILLKNNFTKKNILKVKNFWKKNKIKLYSMQSVLFGINDAYLFGNVNQKKIFLNEIKRKIKIAKNLGAKIIVFGSPKNRKIFSKKSKKLLNIEAISTFKKIAKFSEKNKIVFCLEANPKIYKCDYINFTSEALKIVKIVNNEYFKVNLDVGTIEKNKENVEKLIKKNLNFIGHCQLSNPLLGNFNRKNLNIHKKVILLLKKYKYKKAISIEMLSNNNNYSNVKKSIDIFKPMIQK